MVISACVGLTLVLFNISTNIIEANAEYTMIVIDANILHTKELINANSEEIQIIHEDLKQILGDTSYIRGFIENSNGN